MFAAGLNTGAKPIIIMVALVGGLAWLAFK
jgi:hypothetical protein